MFNNSTKIMFLLIMMMGTLITISSNSWLSAWMGLEINLLAFIPLMSDNKLMSTESALKYFLIQSLASSVLLFSIIMFLLNSNMWNNYLMEMIIFSSLILKMGSAPLHFWFPNVMESLSWMNCLMLMTWQKIAPLMLLSYTLFKSLIIMTIIFSAMIGALGMLNQTSLRKMMAYSSINHLSWMLMALYNSNNMFIMYMLIYTFLNFLMVYMFNMNKISHINQLIFISFHSKPMKIFMFMNLLSLGGLPPFLGFLPKWMIIQYLSMNNQLFMLFIMIMMTLITLFIYMRLCYTTFMLNNFENNWMTFSYYNSMHMNMFMIMSFFSMFGLFIISTLYFML